MVAKKALRLGDASKIVLCIDLEQRTSARFRERRGLA
jgi:predicted ribonuclease YlaK